MFEAHSLTLLAQLIHEVVVVRRRSHEAVSASGSGRNLGDTDDLLPIDRKTFVALGHFFPISLVFLVADALELIHVRLHEREALTIRDFIDDGHDESFAKRPTVGR